MAVVAMVRSVHENVARHVMDMANLFMHVQRVCCVGVCVCWRERERMRSGEEEGGGEKRRKGTCMVYRLCGCSLPCVYVTAWKY